MLTIIAIQGKQYCVTDGQKLVVDRVAAKQGETVHFADLLSGKGIDAQVLEHSLGEKVVSRKFRNKTRYQRTKGHRQAQSVLLFGQSAPQSNKKSTVSQVKAPDNK